MKKKMKKGMGFHLLVDLFGCPQEKLTHLPLVKKLLNEIVEEASLTKVAETFHQFQPQGVTGLILLAESHLSIHTWPEYQSAAVDIFCCAGKETAEKAFRLLLQKFQPRQYLKKTIER